MLPVKVTSYHTGTRHNDNIVIALTARQDEVEVSTDALLLNAECRGDHLTHDGLTICNKM